MEFLAEKIKDPAFWEHAWQEARNSSDFIKKRIRNENETKDFWNNFASRYEKRSAPKEERDRIKNIVELLEQEKILTPHKRVLDVGSGPGTYAIPFAKICKEVVALDSSVEMCRELKKKAKKENLNNIKVINQRWEDAEIGKDLLEEPFDLVFASLVPAVSDFATLKKMIQASHESCCLISWASEAHSQARRDLWEIIFKEKYEGKGQNIIYPFNLLFSMGYFPSLRYFDSDHNYADPVDEAIERLSATFWLFTELTDEVKRAIGDYVKKRAVDNIFKQETLVKLGIILWCVNN